MIPTTEIAQQRTVRLIPTAYYKPPVLKALVDSEEELEALAELEAMTCRRLSDAAVAASQHFDRWGHTFISAAFAYTRPTGNRFNDAAIGGWYAAFTDRTALEEVAFHRTRELLNIGYLHDQVQYVALHASFIGKFHDLRGVDPRPECLDPDPGVGYPAGQALARDLRGAGGRGILYPSARHPGGTCIVALQPNVVQDVSPGAKWKLTWAGSVEWAAETV
ncbi:hypothetical protein mvi_60350 (plasmid) [Methylobacterium indicum]|uniref:RES domain-containing protein n=1 Tax=Methylobacterium indicum TaxID=1775910 RepID=A0A8H8X069_9HYPH|nr:hypothetical protein mvi_60350 [Methylobacterium indicum]